MIQICDKIPINNNITGEFLPSLSMFNFIFKSLPDLRCVVSTSPIQKLHFLQQHPFCSSSLFTVDYLIKSCGLPPEKALATFKSSHSCAPNIKALRESSVPESNIVTLLTNHPRVFISSTVRFKESVDEVKKMSFNPITVNFALAIRTLRQMSKSTWEKKVEVYKKWGLSEDEILVAFRKHTSCMMTSEDKIMMIMDFFVNKIGWESLIVVRVPKLLSLSLERRFIPRCLVYQILLSKGLIEKKFSFTMLESPESQHLKKYEKKYDEEAPELLKLYQEKLNLSK
ncbi:uncharacterized protein LOC132305140 [Cornus florida]|uniref:uncharacterized protein LOC132305140 n=1 Tax=Cornus florida TaxID=4283 RepID=UPI0028A2553D|nr:uncharacterized protein LOC132305140 [Cornus florida]